MTICRSSDLTFDPVGHIYRLDGVVIPHVTGILKAAGFIDDIRYTEFSRERGSAIHRACQYLDEGCLRWDSVDPRIHGYVKAWQRYLLEGDLEVVECERHVLSREHSYAGTLDRVLRRRKTGTLVLEDIKSGAEDPATGLQLAAYARARMEETGLAITDRVAVHVRADGTYREVPYRVTDWATFQLL